VKYVQNPSFKGKCMCAPSFLVCGHLTTSVSAHSLGGTPSATISHS